MDDGSLSVKPNHTYEIKGGDTLWNISRHQLNENGIAAPTQHEIKLEFSRILALNTDAESVSRDHARIYPGMHLILPELTLVNRAGEQNVIEATPEPPKNQPESASDNQTHSHFNSHSQFLRHPEAHGRTYNYFHGLHRLEHKIVTFGRESIDSVNHWLLEVAAKAFLLARDEAQAHGIHIHINSAGRTYEQQAFLYHQLHGRSPVAFPGTSNHETGLAIDVENWREAKPYLLAHGFAHGDGNGPIKNDLWHFKYVGRKTQEA